MHRWPKLVCAAATRLLRCFVIVDGETRGLTLARDEGGQIRRIKIVLAGDAHQGEQRIAPGIGQGGSHAVRRGRLGDRADRPVGGHPFAGRMCQHGGELDEASLLVDRGGLNHGYFLLAETLSDQVESRGQGSVAKRLFGLARK